MSTERFIGRAEELAQLNTYLNKQTASLIVVKGRRRIGKSRLIDEFAKKNRLYKFTGLAPVEGVTAQDQRNEFAHKLSEQTGLPDMRTNDWNKLFALFAHQVKTGRAIVVLDEISWMAADDATFLSKLKNVWEDHLKKNNKLILILCSSVSTWIEENIIHNTAYFGRISWTLTLEPLPLFDCNKMLEQQGFKSSDYEKLKLLSVTGGIPWYIEQMQGEYSANDNIKRQAFTKGGVLSEDFNKIFHELFEKRDAIYKNIIHALANGAVDYDHIATHINYPKSGRLSEYLNNLVQAGFISKDATWSLQTEKITKLTNYRLSDNYIRFYLKYIEPKKNQIEAKRIQKN